MTTRFFLFTMAAVCMGVTPAWAVRLSNMSDQTTRVVLVQSGVTDTVMLKPSQVERRRCKGDCQVKINGKTVSGVDADEIDIGPDGRVVKTMEDAMRTDEQAK